MQFFKIVSNERFHVRKVDGIVFLAVWTNVLVNEFGLTLQDSNALSMEPVLAFVATDVKSAKRKVKNLKLFLVEAFNLKLFSQNLLEQSFFRAQAFEIFPKQIKNFQINL